MAALSKVWKKKCTFQKKVHKQTSHLIFPSIFSSFPNRLSLIEVLRLTAEPTWSSEFWDGEPQRDVCGPVNGGNAFKLNLNLNFMAWNVFNCRTIPVFCPVSVIVNGLSGRTIQGSDSHLLPSILELTFHNSNFI